ncbi:MAG: peptidoglycan-associated lipoprotein Pal [Terriglobales bacterium]
MKRQIRMWILLVLTLCTIMFLGACAKKVAPPPPPAPPSAQPPTASLAANPNTINAGDSTTLTWQTTNATDVSIDGIGTVDTSGSRQVTPAASTTYHLTAKGAGGSQDATARVTVSAPAPPEQPAAPNLTEQELFAQNVKDIYFDYDKADVRPSDQSTIQADAQFLQQHSAIHITVEGYCDERGSTEYNLALGTSRADSVKSALVQAGISGDRIKTYSYGKEKPFCTESTESCWQQNRRGHLVYEK